MSEQEPTDGEQTVHHRVRWRLIALVLIGALLAWSIGRAALRSPPSVSYRAIGVAVPLPAGGRLVPATRKTFDGMLVGERPHPVIVNVWASWCAPCRTEMPLLAKAARTYRGRVTFLGVASYDDPRAAQDFLRRLSISYPNVLDDDGSIRTGLAVTGLPTTFVFDRQGNLRATVTGGLSEQRLAALAEDVVR